MAFSRVEEDCEKEEEARNIRITIDRLNLFLMAEGQLWCTMKIIEILSNSAFLDEKRVRNVACRERFVSVQYG
jgi:hypothetical protein